MEEFHHIFGHPGSTKTKTILKIYFIFNNFNQKIELFNKNYVNRARNKRSQVKHGLLSGFLLAREPKEYVSSDIYGPFMLKTNNQDIKMHLVTFTDIFSRFTKIALLFETTSKAIIECFGENGFQYSSPLNSFLLIMVVNTSALKWLIFARLIKSLKSSRVPIIPPVMGSPKDLTKKLVLC